MAKFTVVIPYYQKQAGILQRALGSVFAQTFQDFDVVIVDDQSPFPIETDLETLSDEQRSRIRVIKQPNAGPGGARNTGLDAVPAQTDFVAFLDSDDLWTPDHLQNAQVTMTRFSADCYWASITGGDAKDVIREIAQSEVIIAESMHGAILADAFRVPWVAVSTSNSINSFKWNDWAHTVGVTYRPRHVPVSSRAEAIIKGAKFWGVDFDAHQPVLDDPNKRQIDETIVVAARAPKQTSLRVAAKQLLAAPSALSLWQAARAAPQLSADHALVERKERFLDVIAGVRRDYF